MRRVNSSPRRVARISETFLRSALLFTRKDARIGVLIKNLLTEKREKEKLPANYSLDAFDPEISLFATVFSSSPPSPIGRQFSDYAGRIGSVFGYTLDIYINTRKVRFRPSRHHRTAPRRRSVRAAVRRALLSPCG